MSGTSGSCLYRSNPRDINELDICDPYKLDCYLANPYLSYWTSAYLNGYTDSTGFHPAGDINAYHATIDYLGRYFDQFLSYIVFYNKMQYESQRLSQVRFDIGWYCRYTADNYGNYFNAESCFQLLNGSTVATPPIPTVKSFCGSMCCYRKAYNLRGWFWLNMQFVLRFFTESVRYINLPPSIRRWRCEVLLPAKTIIVNGGGAVTNAELFLLQYRAPGPSIMYSSFSNEPFSRNCFCFSCCVYDETVTPSAPWVLDTTNSKDIMKYILSPVISCGDGTCLGSGCPSGCSADCIYP